VTDVTDVLGPIWRDHDPGRHPTSCAHRLWYSFQPLQQVGQPGLVIDVVAKATVPAPYLDAGFAIQRVNLKSGIIAKDERPASAMVGASFEQRVFLGCGSALGNRAREAQLTQRQDA
jgi:hypothetical protein